MRAHHVLFSLAAVFAAEVAAPTAAHAQMGVDEREIVNSPTAYPWYTATKVKIGPDAGGRGSAIVISDCSLLTAGHVVYSAENGAWRTIPEVQPGHYYDNATNQGVDPYGSRVPTGLGTNTSWTANLGSDYDYGAIFIGTSFRANGITTHIPLSFDDQPGLINSAGYPSEGLPSAAAGATQEQWHAFGDTALFTTRRMGYEATSTGGASGAGVWVYYGSTGERYLVGVNTAHNNNYDGLGTRLVSQNEGVIEGWQQRPCPGAALPALSWANLKLNGIALNGTPVVKLGVDVLHLVARPALGNFAPSRTVTQIIEGTFYKWQEFHPQGPGAGDDLEDPAHNNPGAGGRPPARFIKLIAPQTAFLSTADAQTLLSASLLWQRAPVARPGVTVSVEPAVVRTVTQGNVPQDSSVANQNRLDTAVTFGK